MKKVLGFVAAAAVIVLSSTGTLAATLTNGGFEDAPNPGPGDQFYFDYNSTNVPSLSGWTVTVNSVDVVSVGPTPYAMGAHGGTQSLDLVGVGSTGGISQGFATQNGATYTLSFWYANNFYSAPGGASAAVMVGDALGSSSLLLANVSHSTSVNIANMDWVNFTALFTADSTTTWLSFLTTFGSNSGGVMLDDVSVELANSNAAAPAPLPASWSMMLIGFATIGGLGLYRRRCLAVAKA